MARGQYVDTVRWVNPRTHRVRLSAAIAMALMLGAVAVPAGPASAKTVKAVKKKIRPRAGIESDSYHFVRSTTPVAPAAVNWKPCFETLDCAIVRAPLDYSDPRSALIDISVVRRKASDPARRIGVMFVNPGGPGGPTSGLVRASARVFPAEINARFDIIGVDPRGTTNSTPVKCGGKLDATRADIDSIYESIAALCAAQSGELLPFIDSVSAARDLDWVRRSLGEAQVSYLGFSYGGYLGGVYADLFPTTLRSVILDSGLDNTVFGTQILADKAKSWERALRAFLTACATGTLTPCAFNDGTDLVVRYQSILAKFPDPRTLRNPSNSRQGIFEETVLQLIEDQPKGWPALATQLAAAATATDPSRVMDASVTGGSGGDASSIFEAFLAYTCRDGQYTRDGAAQAALGAQMLANAPLFPSAALSTGSLTACRYWAAPALSLPPITPVTGTPVLVIGSTLDTLAPYEWSQSLAATTGGTLLTRVGPGHGAIPISTCVAAAASVFMTDLVLPAAGTVCPS